MKIICAWCDKDMGEKAPYQDHAITHGMCIDCQVRNVKEFRERKNKQVSGVRFRGIKKGEMRHIVPT